MSLHRTPSPTTEIAFGTNLGHSLADYQSEINNNTNSVQYPFGISFTTSMPSTSASKTDISYYEKRTAHNALERQRREGLNVKFQELAHVLPGLQQVRRPSKSMIVSKSLEFVSSATKRESDFKGQLSTLKMENEQLLRQADRIKRSFQKRKQKVANPSGSKMYQKKKPVIEKSPSLGSFKSDEDDESDQDAKSTEETKSVDTNGSHGSIGKKSPTSFLPTPKQVVRARRTSSNLKPQVRSITLPTNTKALIDRISYSPPVGASPNKRHREESDSPADPSTTLHDDPSFPTASYSSPPSLPPSSSSPSSSKRPRRSSGSNIVSSSSSFVSPPTLTVYQGPIRPDQFMVNPMVNIIPLSSSSHTRPETSISSSSPQSINSDFQFDIASLGTEQTFYSYDHQHHSSATISAIPAVRMPIVNNDMPSYVPNDFLASAILEDSDDHLFSWDS